MASGIVEPSQPGSEEQNQQQQKQQQQQIARTPMVQRLLAASGSLPKFLEELIFLQAQIVAGTEAAGFLVEPAADGGSKGIQVKAIAHLRPDNSDSDTRAAAINAFQELMRPCIEQGKDGAIKIEGTADAGGNESQYCLVTLLRNEGAVVAASAVITRARDTDRAKKLLMPMQLVAGYFDLFTLRRKDEQSRAIAQSHQHVLQLSTAVATAEGFESSAMNLCNELSARTGAARVSLGWLKGDTIKLKALSHSEEFDKKQELSVQLVKVMEECLDNDEIVQYEPDGQSSNTVTREAQALSRSQGGETIISLPLRRQGEIVGIVTLEFAPNSKLGPQVATGLAVAVELIAPQLYDRYQNDRYIFTKAGLSIQEVAKKTYGPTHMLPKTITAAVILVVLFLVLFRPMYHVKATFQFVPDEKRSLSSPFDGMLAKLGTNDKGEPISAGDHIKAGQVLAEFDATDWKLQRDDAVQEVYQHESEIQRYSNDNTKNAERAIALHQKEAAQAKADALQVKIDRAKIVAPFDGEITSGDLRDKRGAMFKQGDPLFEVSQLTNLQAEIAVDERDIQDVHKGSSGYLATTSLPREKFHFVVDRIVPQSRPKESTNLFTVYATLDTANGQWRPGEQGEARIDVAKEPLIWIWTHRFADFVRMKLWM